VKKGGETGFRVLPWGHRHPLSGGTANPRVVPTWPRFCAVKKGVALSLTMCTATAWRGAPSGVVRCRCRFLPEAGELVLE
jgi:hypothetical protein